MKFKYLKCYCAALKIESVFLIKFYLKKLKNVSNH